MSVEKIQTNVHSIPVVFDVNAPNEEEGARVLANFLGAIDLVRRLSVGIEIESWSMPNNEDADGSDHEGMRLAWVKENASLWLPLSNQGFESVQRDPENLKPIRIVTQQNFDGEWDTPRETRYDTLDEALADLEYAGQYAEDIVLLECEGVSPTDLGW